LPRRARADPAVVDAAPREAVLAGLEQLERACLGIVPLRLRDLRLDAIAGEPALDEHDVAVAARYSEAAVGKVLDPQVEQLSDTRAGASLPRRVLIAGHRPHFILAFDALWPLFAERASPVAFCRACHLCRRSFQGGLKRCPKQS